MKMNTDRSKIDPTEYSSKAFPARVWILDEASTSRDIVWSTMKTRFVAVISTTRLDISTFPAACVFNVDDRIVGYLAVSDGVE